LAYFTFGTLVDTLRVLVVVLLHQAAFGTQELFTVIFDTIGTVVTFSIPVAILQQAIKFHQNLTTRAGGMTFF